MACAASLAVLDTIAGTHLLDHVKRIGEHLAGALEALGSPLVAQVRGAGLWRGVALTGDHAAAVETVARNNGLLVNAVKPSVLRLAPPLVVTDDDVDRAVAILGDALAAVAP